MRIALVILHADPQRGGAERYTADLANALAAGGHDVSLCATTFADASGPAIKLVPLSTTARTRSGRYRQTLAQIDRLTQPGNFEIVHAMFPVRRCDLYHPHAGLAVDATDQAALTTSLFNPRRQMMAEVERQLLAGPRPPLVLCLSDAMRAEVARRYANLPADRTAKLFNAVDLARFDPAHTDIPAWISAAVPPTAPIIALVAQDFERKGVATAIAALAQLRSENPDLRLVVAGGDRPGKFKRLARQMGVADRVVFTGSLPDVRPLYRSAQMLLLPTRSDPCSLVVLEALAMGLPVITTRCNGASEIMTDGVHGFILDQPDNAAELAERMRAILQAKLRSEMATACLALRPGLSFDTHVQSLVAIYQTITRAPSPPTPRTRAAAPHPPPHLPR
jgi:UDP-glucose:(heptosyl)LPS alpha-1,3-glucosyltransferase